MLLLLLLLRLACMVSLGRLVHVPLERLIGSGPADLFHLSCHPCLREMVGHTRESKGQGKLNQRIRLAYNLAVALPTANEDPIKVRNVVMDIA